MKTRLLAIIGIISLIAIFVTPPAHASYTDSILVLVEGDFRKVYYNEKNVTSVFSDPYLGSVLFETGSDAELEIKSPKAFESGPGMFVLKNGEEMALETTSDDCFHYASIETKNSETIEIVFAYWPEYPETKKGCETFTVPPAKQSLMGISPIDTICVESLQLIFKYDGSPACVNYSSVDKLLERGFTPVKSNNNSPYDQTEKK